MFTIVNFFLAKPAKRKSLVHKSAGSARTEESQKLKKSRIFANHTFEMNDKAMYSGFECLKEEKTFMYHMPAWVNYYYSSLRVYIDKLQNYKRVKKEFYDKLGYELKLDSPRSLNEKVTWKKLFDRNPLLTVTADKYEVRSYLKNLLDKEEADKLLIPLLYVTEDPNDISFENLPEKYVIKPNHGSRMHLIIKNNKEVSPSRIIKLCKLWLKNNYGFYTHEWAYKDIKRKIVVEKLLETKNGNLPLDYKFFCFHAECKVIRAALNRFGETNLSGYFDKEWNVLPVCRPGYQSVNTNFDKPVNLDKMIQIAEKISKDFDFVRVDLYNCDGDIYFGEFTHYPTSGLARFEPAGFDYTLGDYWDLKPYYWK